MKKLLSILGAVSLTASGVSGIVANNPYIKNWSKKIWKKKLTIEGIEQLYDYNCVSTSVQMILNYYHVDINIYNQDRIHSDLGGRLDFGVVVGQSTANYINNLISSENHYYYNQLGAGYGSTEQELRLFQQYVVNSISLNSPLLFAYDPSRGDAHATVIYGVNIDENPRNTQYYIMDPSTGRTATINGLQLSTYLKMGGDLIGISDNFDFKNKTIKIKNFTTDSNKWDGPIYGNHPSDIWENVNLTETAGITSFSDFTNSVSYITLDNFSEGFYYDGMNLTNQGDAIWNDNISEEWTGWKWENRLSTTLDYGLNTAFLDVWHGTRFLNLPDIGLLFCIYFRENSECSGFAKLPVLYLNLGSQWTLHFK